MTGCYAHELTAEWLPAQGPPKIKQINITADHGPVDGPTFLSSWTTQTGPFGGLIMKEEDIKLGMGWE